MTGTIKAEVLDENKWVRMGLNGTIHARLIIDRPCRIEPFVDMDGSLAVLVFDGLEPVAGEQPIATLGRKPHPDPNWTINPDGTLTEQPRDNKGGK